MNYFRQGTFKFNIPKEIRSKIDTKTIFLIENIGIPRKIVYAEIDFFPQPFIEDEYLVFGFDKNLSEMKYSFELKTAKVVSYGVINHKDYYSVINGSIEKLLLSSFCNDFFLNRLIMDESLGPYYDNSPTGGNFEKYANLLKEMILDIDERAANEGAWHSLIEEMSMGVI